MSLTYKKRGGREYLYFQAGTEGTYYIAPKDDLTRVNIEGIRKSLNYAIRRFQNYQEIVNQLLSYLPEDERRKYLQKEERLRRVGPELSKEETPLIIEQLVGHKLTSNDMDLISDILSKLKKRKKGG